VQNIKATVLSRDQESVVEVQRVHQVLSAATLSMSAMHSRSEAKETALYERWMFLPKAAMNQRPETHAQLGQCRRSTARTKL
jgi:hypothetical protein